MNKHPDLYVIEEPETPVKREVLHLSGIRSHGPAVALPVGRPWPRQVDLREYLRRKKAIGVRQKKIGV